MGALVFQMRMDPVKWLKEIGEAGVVCVRVCVSSWRADAGRSRADSTGGDGSNNREQNLHRESSKTNNPSLNAV